MSKSIEKINQNADLQVMPQVEPVGGDVLEQLKAYADSWGAAATIAEQMARTDFAGQFKGKPADMAAAILKGASVGIQPADVGKAIYVVHGAPALYGKTAMQIARSHGYKFERVEFGPKKVHLRCYAPDGDSDESIYTYERATREGLVKGNKQQYETRPEKMLFWKCVGELADQFFPHLTGGMGIKEDMEQSPIKATAVRKDRPSRGSAGLRAVLDQYEADSRDVQDADVEEGESVELSEAAEIAASDIQAVEDRNLIKGILDEVEPHVSKGEFKVLKELGTTRWREMAPVQEGEQE